MCPVWRVDSSSKRFHSPSRCRVLGKSFCICCEKFDDCTSGNDHFHSCRRVLGVLPCFQLPRLVPRSLQIRARLLLGLCYLSSREKNSRTEVCDGFKLLTAGIDWY